MANLEQKLHAPGIMTFRAKGQLSDTDVESWREELVKFVKDSEKTGACGVLIDMCDVDGIAIDAIDTLMELIADPEEALGTIRMRFALIGVKPFTQRFLREALPLEEVKYIRARFFHEVSESEALAWLKSMVSSADALPETKTRVEQKLESKSEVPSKAQADLSVEKDSKQKHAELPIIAEKEPRSVPANEMVKKPEANEKDKKPESVAADEQPSKK